MHRSCNWSAAIAAAFVILLPVVSARAQCPQATINVVILTDDAPQQTTWQLRNQANGALVGSGGPYTGQPNTLISVDVCVVTASCHDWTIFDSGGDGISGGGGYQISLNGEVVGESGSFGGAQESVVNIGTGCIGACCLASGACQESTTPDACASQSGIWQSTGVTCAAAGCLPFGACCFSDGSCTTEESAPCIGAGGTYQGNGSDCSPNPCPQPTGACCMSGACTVQTAAACASAGGTYDGNGTNCSPNPCPQSCPQDTINVLILTDAAPEETTWELRDQSNNALVASGGPFTGQPFVFISTDICVDPTHCYGWTIFDSAGDGISGGGYQISLNDVVVADSGDFDDDEETVPDIGNGCSGVTGRCCFSDGSCTVVTPTACAAAESAYQGDGTNCTINLCPQPMGACCAGLSGSCSIETSTACAAAGGTYQGDDTTCTPNPCPCPQDTINVLILTDAAPEETTWELRDQSNNALVAAGGPYPGQPTEFISINVCVQTTHCYGWTIFDSGGDGIAGGGYQISLNDVVIAESGDFDDNQETVADIGNGCSGVTGRCCLPDGSCTVVTAAACASAEGTYAGDGTACSPNPCLQPTGACCVGATCSIQSPTACASSGGVYQGNGTSCSPNPCSQTTTGACCDGESCSIQTAAACAAASGTYEGNGTTCSPNPCVCPGMDVFNVLILTDAAPQDTTWKLNDESNNALVASGGPYPGQPSQYISTNVCIDPTKCYYWSILDQAGNGITDGGYQLSINEVVLVASGSFTGALEVVPDLGSTCATGACCFEGGSCEVETVGTCTSLGGTYQGNATTCSPNPCVQPTGACCFLGGMCADDVTLATCNGADGDYQGDLTECATATCPLLRVLFVVTNSAAPTAQEQARATFLTGQGYTVTLLTALSTQPQYDAAVSSADVAYVSEEITSGDVALKLTPATIGVVNEEAALYDELGISSSSNTAVRTSISILDDAHPITSVFNIGALTITTSSQQMTMLQGTLAAGADVLAQNLALDNVTNLPALTAIETGTAIIGGTAAGRRVMLPWGGTDFAFAALNASGQTVLVRSLDWAAGALDETGACCFTDGSCADDLGVIECELVEAGSWNGASSTCEAATCAAPPGACCLTNGTCQVVADQPACTALGGTFQGSGTTCGATTCEGACCVSGVCQLAPNAGACTAQGGTFQGVGVQCATVQCETPCLADFNNDGTVGFFDLTNLLAQWQTAPNGQAPYDINGDHEVGFFDLTYVLTHWGLCPP